MLNAIMEAICMPLGYLMKFCFDIVGNYGLAVILFTLCTKIVLAPVSTWVHYNSIKMVKIQPDINFMKARLYGNPEQIAEEQTKLYKKANYHPLLSSIPLLIQLLLLACVVYIIKEPLTHILHIDADTCKILADAIGVDSREGQLAIVKAVHDGSLTTAMLESGAAQAAIAPILELDLSFLGFDLGTVANNVWGIYILVPVIAGISSLALCWSQNKMNVLQKEQTAFNRYGMTVLSVGISLLLGFIVYAGVALYWVASNLFAILQQVVLNLCINPWKRVDHEQLEKSRKALADIEALDSKNKKDAKYKENRKRERADYKRFFKVVNKHLVIYSEKSGFYKYFEALINQLLSRSNLTIHYITNDPDDVIFGIAEKEPRIKPYYIGNKRIITLMMRMDADIVAMTTPDLEKLYIKRSLLRKDIEYIYLPHDMMSTHVGFREGAFDAFDTIFCVGPHVDTEIRAMEKFYGTHEKNLVHFGYPFAEKLIASADECLAEQAAERAEKGITEHRPEILIAPSWQEDNLLDSCIDQLIEQLVCGKYHVTVRPHPEYSKRYPDRLKAIVDKYSDRVGEDLTFELDFSGNRSIYSSDLLITDWSGISFEFSFATGRPSLFINTKLKCLNMNWDKIGVPPREIELRDQVGVSLDKDKLNTTRETVESLLADPEKQHDKIIAIRNAYLYDIGDNGKTGARYILSQIQKKQNERKD